MSVRQFLLYPSVICCLIAFATGCAVDNPPVCQNLPGTPQEIAQSPRSDGYLEFLAIKLSNKITAETEIYNRLVRDVEAIRSINPEMRKIGHLQDAESTTRIVIQLDEVGVKQFRRGDYKAWNCLNDHYQAVDIEGPRSGAYVAIRFDGRLNAKRLSELYRPLSHVLTAEPSVLIGGGPSIYPTPERDDWHYVFDDASGDCASGCTDHKLSYFVVNKDGIAVKHGSWSDPDWLDLGKKGPLWVQKYFVDAIERLSK